MNEKRRNKRAGGDALRRFLQAVDRLIRAAKQAETARDDLLAEERERRAGK
jgi:hypothetical protein